jgi:hypothetical protein
VLPKAGNGGDSERGNGEIEAIVEVPESVTSQSRHSLTLSGSPPHGKLLIPFERRDVRVVEGARLENEWAEQRQATPRHLIAQPLSDLAVQQDHSVCIDKPPYGWRF